MLKEREWISLWSGNLRKRKRDVVDDKEKEKEKKKKKKKKETERYLVKSESDGGTCQSFNPTAVV